MGGVPPLGYDVENRRLVPNEREAKLIRHIFQRFVELGSSTALVKELKLDGVTSKAWTTQDGKTRDGRPIDKGHIYKLLSNRTYLGELRHKDQWYQAEHPPIVSRELWDSVHAILETNGRVRGNTTRAKVPYLLKGIVFGNDGRALSPWHTTKKNGRRYRYYVPQRDAKEHAGASGLPRLPAAELESAVLDQLRAILRAPNLLGEMLPQAIKLDPTLDEAKITVAMIRLDAIWDQLFPAEQTRIVKLLVEKVMAVPVEGIAPSRKALSTNVLVSSGFSPSSAMMRSSSSTFFLATKACHSASTWAFGETESTNASIRSFLLRRDGLELIARSMVARISLSWPVPLALM